ncbi:glutathione S-transferase family protein [Profundibacterium mesophilum]|uniref:Glutathione S-transferase n=1 Tax=Profundibacterium mesophilum KAUST100406-0324 TaxID=1037889 RepID=A0A921TC11_9RHOB|nr:glutathione S-transferase family protein [Profundibacterium mesophilum]KAF0676515.1 glutathione S-transferase [Profundibacterium mesophilum KAUST100406-0324]
MTDRPVLYGFDGSTYVRTVRTVLRRKGIDYEQVTVNVLEGEPRQPEHLARHPFGKVPVLDIDGMRLRETDAICRYLDAAHETPAVIPRDIKDRARMDEIMSLTHAYGYDALIGAVGFHLFPDFIGGADEAKHDAALERSRTFLSLVDEIRGEDPWAAGEAVSLADYYLGPLLLYVSLTPDAGQLLGTGRTADLWERLQGDEDFKATAPDLG